MNRRNFIKGVFLSLGAIFVAPELIIPEENIDKFFNKFEDRDATMQSLSGFSSD